MGADQFGAFEASEADAGWHWRATLELPEYASLEEIKQAYRLAVKQVHPDLHPDDATAARHFSALQEAYEALIASASWRSLSRFIDPGEGQC
jgi:DnaJ-class molecular chaperone